MYLFLDQKWANKIWMSKSKLASFVAARLIPVYGTLGFIDNSRSGLHKYETAILVYYESWGKNSESVVRFGPMSSAGNDD